MQTALLTGTLHFLEDIHMKKEQFNLYKERLYSRSAVTVRHELRTDLEKYLSLLAQKKELENQLKELEAQLIPQVQACGMKFTGDGDCVYHLVTIQRKGVGCPIVLMQKADTQRVDYAGYLKSQGITAEAVKQAGYSTPVKGGMTLGEAKASHVKLLVEMLAATE
jgi:hypothetical protein